MLVVSLLLLYPANANAQDAASEQESILRFEEGKALHKLGKLDDARVKYRQSIALANHPNALFNMASIEDKLGRPAEALRYARAFIRHPRAKPQHVAEAKKQFIEDLGPKTGHANVIAPPGTIVRVDGIEVGKTPLEDVVDVMPGAHSFVTVDRVVDVTFAAGETKDVRIEKESVPAGSSVSTGSGSSVGSGSNTGTGVPPRDTAMGRSTLGYLVPIGVGVLGVTGLVLSGVFAGGSNSAKSDAQKLAPGCAQGADCTQFRTAIDDQKSKDTLSKVFLVGGGVLALGGAALFFLWPKSAVTVTPTIGRATGGLNLVGTF
jgi:tetratricopeptide (TPR) repeat protein